MGSLIGANLKLLGDQSLCKPARAGRPIYWRQDNACWKCMLAMVVTCWLALENIDAGNGIMLRHRLAFHASGPTRSGRDRRAFAFRYTVPGTTTPDASAMPLSFRHPMVSFAG